MPLEMSAFEPRRSPEWGATPSMPSYPDTALLFSAAEISIRAIDFRWVQFSGGAPSTTAYGKRPAAARRSTAIRHRENGDRENDHISLRQILAFLEREAGHPSAPNPTNRRSASASRGPV